MSAHGLPPSSRPPFVTEYERNREKIEARDRRVKWGMVTLLVLGCFFLVWILADTLEWLHEFARLNGLDLKLPQ